MPAEVQSGPCEYRRMQIVGLVVIAFRRLRSRIEGVPNSPLHLGPRKSQQAKVRSSRHPTREQYDVAEVPSRGGSPASRRGHRLGCDSRPAVRGGNSVREGWTGQQLGRSLGAEMACTRVREAEGLALSTPGCGASTRLTGSPRGRTGCRRQLLLEVGDWAWGMTDTRARKPGCRAYAAAREHGRGPLGRSVERLGSSCLASCIAAISGSSSRMRPHPVAGAISDGRGCSKRCQTALIVVELLRGGRQTLLRRGRRTAAVGAPLRWGSRAVGLRPSTTDLS